tara:strand:+ start:427 stop:837 length:411 start_codon:yes stop_codon:yes gene_type:complete
MPKPKPTEVIRHEIVLGRSERDLLEGALMAYGFNRVATPIVAGLSDISFTVTVAGILAAIGIITSDEFEQLVSTIESEGPEMAAAALGRIASARRQTAELMGTLEPVFGILPGWDFFQKYFYGWEPDMKDFHIRGM